MAQPANTKPEANGTKIRYETVLNGIRKEAQKIREANEKLQEWCTKMDEHPAPATTLLESVAVIRVALEHVRSVFREF